MTTLKASLQNAMKDAMRAKEKDRLGTIRLMLAAIKQIEVDERIEVDDARCLTILDKLAKQRRESIDQFQQAGRDDLVKIEQNELALIQTFLPEPLSDAEITQLVQSAINDSGAGSMKDMGKVMTILKPQLQGRADMGRVSQQIKALLNS